MDKGGWMGLPPNFLCRGRSRPKVSCLLTTLGPVDSLFILVQKGGEVRSLSNFSWRDLRISSSLPPGAGPLKPGAGSSAFLTGLPAGSGFLGEATAGHPGGPGLGTRSQKGLRGGTQA